MLQLVSLNKSFSSFFRDNRQAEEYRTYKKPEQLFRVAPAFGSVRINLLLNRDPYGVSTSVLQSSLQYPGARFETSALCAQVEVPLTIR